MVAINSFMKWSGLCWDVLRKIRSTHSFVMHWSCININAHKGHASYTNKKCTPWHILLFNIKLHTLTNLFSCIFIIKRKAQTSMWYFYSLKDTHLIYNPWSMKLFQEDKTKQQSSQKFLYQKVRPRIFFLSMLGSMHKNIVLGVDIFLNWFLGNYRTSVGTLYYQSISSRWQCHHGRVQLWAMYFIQSLELFYLYLYATLLLA